MPEVNLLAVLLCGFASMVLGALWYSPALFGRRWQTEAQLSDAEIAGGNMVLIYGLAFVSSMVAAFVFGMFLGSEMTVGAATAAGAAAGLFWVAAAFGISYLFERRSFAHWAINGGYHAVQFTLFGLILGAMS